MKGRGGQGAGRDGMEGELPLLLKSSRHDIGEWGGEEKRRERKTDCETTPEKNLGYGL